MTRAPAWLVDATLNLGCVASGSNDCTYVGAFVRPGHRGHWTYTVCSECIDDLPGVLRVVEELVGHGESLERCTAEGGAA
jgi:hypothetical protein